jgi:hypothetical protein
MPWHAQLGDDGPSLGVVPYLDSDLQRLRE